uniref:Uncharacterized protein n=1 Tax=Attheya septentrionalis TaxID=420275 RepID=A0A7S2XKU6_9STRA
MGSNDLNSMSQQQRTTNSSYLDEEEASEQEELRRVTSMYIAETDDISGCDGEASYDDVNSVDNSEANESNDELDVQHQHVNAHLLDLSKSIAAKEELVEQLFLSQKKYESMKGFYEEKLNLMESQLSDVENEREKMMSELQAMEENNTSSSQSFTTIKERLKEKEKHIASLRKKQRELLSLTTVSSKNDQVINRLRLDIESMKHQRVDIQRRISHERKVHTAEVMRLKKDVLHHNRDAAKWKKESEKNRLEAEKAHKMAQSRLEKVSKLRNKYKETEKKKRMQTLKRGVLARVGLDSVLVGRKANKNKKRALDGPVAPTPKRSGSFRKPKPAPIDMDSLREFFDEKIADVGRKETTADKLAEEWEDHLDLLGRKEELLSTTLNDELSEEQKNDELEGINIQIQYKETRIRQLTSRLTPRTPTNNKKNRDIDHKSFIEDPVLTLFPGASTLAAAQAASRVLFGMVVREQRKVTSLARATSALQEKLEEADAQVEAKEAALRAHMEEERHERVSRAQDEQERILSLMSLVQQGETQQPSIEEADGVGVDSLVIMLAEERITLLEKQVVELEKENDLNKALKAKESEMSLALGEKEKEYDTIVEEVNLLRSTILQIRDQKKKSSERLAKTATESSLNNQISHSTTESTRDDIDKLVDDAMHYMSSDSPRGRESGKMYPQNNILRGLPPVDNSDSEDDEEIPDWADDIMADLALIARGDMPPALLKDGKPPMIHSSPARSTSKSVQQRGPPRSKTSSGGSVFDRLANPGNFTGIQKHRTRQHANISMDDRSIDSRGSSRSMFGRKKGASDENSVNGMSSSSIFRPGQEPMEVNVPRSIDAKISDMNSSFESTVRKDDSMNKKASSNDEDRSVFERLQSPSNYTGISKQNHVSARKAPRSRDTFRYGDTDDDLSTDGQETVSSNRYAASPNIRRTVSKNPSDTGGHSSASETPSKSSMSEYTQQDVYERLQRTTTKAYTEKHRFDILAANSDHQSNNINDPPKKPVSSSEHREPTLVVESSDTITPQDKTSSNGPPSLSRTFPSFEIDQSSESGETSSANCSITE